MAGAAVFAAACVGDTFEVGSERSGFAGDFLVHGVMLAGTNNARGGEHWGKKVLVTGATGYLGRELLPVLVARGHVVRALVRGGSERKVPPGVVVLRGNPLVAADVGAAMDGMDTLVHLVGVPKPSPRKAREFRTVDLASIRASVEAAAAMEVPPHIIYLSVAQPAPVMKAYIAVREEGEAMIRSRGFAATMLRPWYVLGPGHRWPMVLLPFYTVARWLPFTRAGADRLGFVTLEEMTVALVHAVENPPERGVHIVDAPAIKALNKPV
jgi:uncharacterized protein YbjT (DUF2867 family)